MFVPVRYLYPSRTQALRGLSLVLTAVWVGTYALLLVQYPDPNPFVVVVSLAYLVYYVAVSGWLTAAAARRRRHAGPVTTAGRPAA